MLTLEEVRSSSAAVLTVVQVAQLLDVDERTVRRACTEGQLPVLTVGRRMLIPRAAFLAVLQIPDIATGRQASAGGSEPSQ